MSTNTKGAELERKAMTLLMGWGYLVHRTVRTPIIKYTPGQPPRIIGSHNNDVFGAFDLIATRPDGMAFIQVTDTSNVAARRDKVEPVAKHLPKAVSVEVWGWVGGRKRRHKTTGAWIRRQYFRIFKWTGSGWRDETGAAAGWVDGPPPLDAVAEAL